MKGDFTRSTFDPRKHYSSVRMQQGRVQLDADWNEQMDVLGHRIETEAVDVIGRCGFPASAPGFEIKALPEGGDLLIGAGRAYVDGILCELESGPQVTFMTQPHLPDAAELDNPSAGVYFAYLDVWRRHVTAIEDEALREVALGGPDTATRLQTIWQVKLVKVGETLDDLDCDSEPDAWKRVIEPPTGKLRARTRPVEDPDDPCIVPASAGYTRLENQLYRVEVHEGGALTSEATMAGPPTFKWSRDNGSIATRWLSQNGDKLTVESAGRDSVLRFVDGGWLELTDDARELSGVPGEMWQAERVEGNVIKIKISDSDAVDISQFSPVRKARRWDSAGALLIEQAGDHEGYLALEGGIEVRFEEGTYRTGDYWLIPARAFIGEFSGDVEWPRNGADPLALPPRGIGHHYCKLALVELGPNGSIKVLSDCRDVFAPLTGLEVGVGGCCEVVVRPGGDIQKAIALLPDDGGAVCLKAGRHEIVEAIRIEKSNVTLRGESPGARVIRANGVDMVVVAGLLGSSNHVEIEGIRFEVARGDSEAFLAIAPDETPALIRTENCDDFWLKNCVLTVAPEPATSEPPQLPDAVVFEPAPFPTPAPPPLPVTVAAGVVARGGSRMKVRGNEMSWVTVGVITVQASRVEVAGNVFTGPVFPATGSGPASAGAVGVWIGTSSGAHRIERNRFTDFKVGVQLESGGGDHSLVAGNEIVRQGPFETDAFAIEIAADECTVRDNVISLHSRGHCGIHVVGQGAHIESNLVESQAEETTGILLGNLEDPPLSHEGVIRNNRLTGTRTGILIVAGRGAQVLDNRIEGESGQPEVTGLILVNTDEARVAGNRISTTGIGAWLIGGQGCRCLDNHMLDGDTGFFVPWVSALQMSRNRVERMKRWGFLAYQAQGSLTLSGDHYAFCGYEGKTGECAGIGVVDVWGEVGIEGCEVVNTGSSFDGSQAEQALGIAVLLARDCRIHSNLVGYTTFGLSPTGEHRALLLQGSFDQHLETFFVGGTALVTDNKLTGPGWSCLIELMETKILDSGPTKFWYRFSRVTFNDNDCVHTTSRPQGTPEGRATIWLHGSRATVSGNQITSFVPSVHFHGVPGVFVGNSVSLPAIGLPVQRPNPQDQFNLVG